MKLQDEKRELQSNVTGQKKFTIEATAKAFRTLSDRLYSNKIKAVVRELATNAYDAHIEKGNIETPFIVHLPNNLEPTFYIEDFGVGMSEEIVMNLYSSFFASNKSDTNLVTGALGLGSKSPFAYTDNFIVISWYERVMKTYSCFLNEEAVPCVVKIAEEETNRENGVRVEITVESSDFYDFENEAKIIFRPFKNIPKIIGVSNFSIKNYGDTIIKNGNWKFYREEYSYVHNLFAVQGNIEYKIDLQTIKENISITLLNKYNIDTEYASKIIKLFQNTNCIINFPIGSLGFTTNREELEYTKLTIENIFIKLLDVYADLMLKIIENFKTYDKKIDLILNYWAIRKTFNDHLDFSSLKIDNVLIDDKLQLNSTFQYENDFLVYDSQTYGRFDDQKKCVKKSNYSLEKNAFSIFFNETDSRDNVRIVYHDQQETEKTLKSGIFRLRQNVKEQEFKAVLIFNKALLTELNELEYDLISEYDYIKKPGIKSEKKIYNVTKIEFIVENNKLEEYKYIQELYSLLDDTNFIQNPEKIYVTKHYKYYQCEDIHNSIETFSHEEIWKYVKTLFEFEKKAGAIFNENESYFSYYVLTKEVFKKKIIKELKWEGIIKNLKQKLDKIIDNTTVTTAIKNKIFFESINDIERVQVKTVNFIKKTFLNKYENRLAYLVNKIDTSADNNNIFQLPYYVIKSTIQTFKLGFLEEENYTKKGKKLYFTIYKMYTDIVRRKYPMLKHIDLDRIYEMESFLVKSKEINSYIEMINKNN